MDEYIEREALIRKIRHFAADVIFRGCKVVMADEESCNPVEWTKGYEQGLKDAANLIVGQPTIDAVSVVRCKDCIVSYCVDYEDIVCGRTCVNVDADDFCSYGERKDGGK